MINKKGIISLILSVFVLVVTVFTFNTGISIEHPVVISKDVATSIYMNNNFSYNYGGGSDIDNNITEESLANVKVLVIDVNSMGNSDFFKHCVNLEDLTIRNYQKLSKEDLNNLYTLDSLKKLYIYVDGEYALKYPDYRIDLDKFANLKKVSVTTNLSKEIDAYISYVLVKDNKIKDIVFEDDVTYEQVSTWDKEIDKIISSMNITSDMTDKVKLDKAIKYVTNTLSYDKEIYNSFMNNSTEKMSDKIHAYNVKLLSSVLDNNKNNKSAICCNYAGLTNILLYKLGIESYYIVGTVDGDRHAWNYINVDGKDYFLDLTFYDNDGSITKPLISTKNDMYKDYILPVEEIIVKKTMYYNLDAAKVIIKYGNNVLNIK